MSKRTEAISKYISENIGSKTLMLDVNEIFILTSEEAEAVRHIHMALVGLQPLMDMAKAMGNLGRDGLKMLSEVNFKG